MTNKKISGMSKTVSLIPIFVWGIMILDIILLYIFGELPRSISNTFTEFGIWLGFFFLIMCGLSPIIGIMCGIAGMIYAKKAKATGQSANKWLLLSMMDVVIAIVSLFPFTCWLLAAFSGQI